MGYTTTSNLLEAVPDASAVDTAVLQRFIDRASSVIDGAIGRSFPIQDAEVSDRIFHGTGTYSLQIDYHQGDDLVTAVTLPSGWVAPFFVELRDDVNETCYLRVTDSEGRIYRNGQGRSWPWGGSALAVWPEGLPITVSAQWGYAAIPGDVEDACIAIAMAAYRETYAMNEPEWRAQIGLDGKLPPRAADILRGRMNQYLMGVSG